MEISGFDIVIALIFGACGLGSGIWLRAWAWTSPDPASPQIEPPDQVEARKEQQRRAQEAMHQVHDVASRVAADVGAHTSRVQEINDALRDGEHTEDAFTAAMDKLLQANREMQSKLEAAESRLQEQAKKMESYEEQALTDALTGIANRRAFDEFIERQFLEFQRDGRPATVLMLDVDHFKKFNDTYGHAAGDEVLKGVAQALTRTMRDIDLVARYGGEEFSVIFPGTGVREAGPATERARAAIESAVFHHQGTELKVTASFGIAELRSGETITETVKRADDALYKSKNAGRNMTHWHDGVESHPLSERSVRCAEAPTNEALAKSPESRAAVHPEVPENTPRTDLGIDAETQLSNRQSFVDDVRRRLAEWKRTQTPLALVTVGIDQMDTIQENLGKTGRHVAVKAATQFLKAAMREMDHVARLDEGSFGLLLPGATLHSAEIIAERLRHAIAKCSLEVAGEQLRFTISNGATEARHGDDAEKFLQRASDAAQAAQNSGANRTFVHNGKGPELTTKSVSSGM